MNGEKVKILWAILLIVLVSGCELIASVDRDRITNSAGAGGTGGSVQTGGFGGTGGATTTGGMGGGPGGSGGTGGTGGIIETGGGGTGGEGGNTCNDPEVCDGIDNNCMDGIDEGDTCTPTISFAAEADGLHKAYLLDQAFQFVASGSTPDSTSCVSGQAASGTVGVNYRYLYWDNDGNIEFVGENLKNIEVGWICSELSNSPCPDVAALSAEYSSASSANAFTPITPTKVGDPYTNTYTISVPAGTCPLGTVTLYVRVLSVLP